MQVVEIKLKAKSDNNSSNITKFGIGVADPQSSFTLSYNTAGLLSKQLWGSLNFLFGNNNADLSLIYQPGTLANIIYQTANLAVNFLDAIFPNSGIIQSENEYTTPLGINQLQLNKKNIHWDIGNEGISPPSTFIIKENQTSLILNSFDQASIKTAIINQQIEITNIEGNFILEGSYLVFDVTLDGNSDLFELNGDGLDFDNITKDKNFSAQISVNSKATSESYYFDFSQEKLQYTNLNLDSSLIDQDTELTSGFGSDSLITGNGNDTIYADNQSEDGYQNHGNDTVNGMNGDDWIQGNAGNDIIIGGNGGDTLRGGKGNDSIYGESLSDSVDEDPGSEPTGSKDDMIVGGRGNDEIYGGSGDDNIFGDNSRTKDTSRWEYNDTINGGSGKDTIDGGYGDDTITGGSGNDLFIFKPGDDNDTITDFEASGIKDIIDLSAYQTSFNSLLIENTNYGARIQVPGYLNDSITLNGIDKADLVESDFHFI